LPASVGVTALDLLKHTLRDGFNRCGDIGGEANSGAEIAPLDSINHQASWKLVQGPAEFDGFGQAEGVGRAAKLPGRQGIRGGIKAGHRSGACA
jgi:hypothetical protein